MSCSCGDREPNEVFIVDMSLVCSMQDPSSVFQSLSSLSVALERESVEVRQLQEGAGSAGVWTKSRSSPSREKESLFTWLRKFASTSRFVDDQKMNTDSDSDSPSCNNTRAELLGHVGGAAYL